MLNRIKQENVRVKNCLKIWMKNIQRAIRKFEEKDSC